MKIDSLSGEKYSRSPAVAPDESRGNPCGCPDRHKRRHTGQGQAKPLRFQRAFPIESEPARNANVNGFGFGKEWLRCGVRSVGKRFQPEQMPVEIGNGFALVVLNRGGRAGVAQRFISLDSNGNGGQCPPFPLKPHQNAEPVFHRRQGGR